MAVSYPGIGYLKGYNTDRDIAGEFFRGLGLGKGVRDEAEAPDTFAKALPPLQEYGLGDSDTMRALFANPNTRDMAIAQVKEAQQRRADANDPLKQLQLRKAQYEVNNLGRVDPTAEMRNFSFAQSNPAFQEFIGGMGAQNAPAAVQEYLFYRKGELDAGRQPMPYVEFKQSAKGGTGGLSANERSEIFDAQDLVNSGGYALDALDTAISLNDKAFEGPLADWRGDAAAVVGMEGGKETAQLRNLTTELALTQLKAVFGGMPTEGERKILLEMQGSVNQPKAVRAEIFARAKQMAERRIADSQTKADAIRSGAIYEPGYGTAPAAPQATGPGWTVLGVE